MRLPTRLQWGYWFHQIRRDFTESAVTTFKGMGVFIRLCFLRSRVVTCPQGVVSYEAYAPDRECDIIDRKIMDILAANPDADLRALQDVLNIKITNVQKSANQPPQQSDRIYL